MSVGPLITEIVVAFCLATTLLYRYGNIFRNHIVVTISVLIAWYFSLLIIFVLPLDVSSTVYRQCVEYNNYVNSSNSHIDTGNITTKCKKPWSSVPDDIFPNLWRIVYWTSQCLTWLILPIMQSYIKAGDFTMRGKLKSALIDNAIYYGSYLSICGILLIYIALKPDLDLDGQKLKAIASSASNTWGLFLLVLLLGYALVEVPRGLWNASKPGFVLQYSYFKASKLYLEKCEAEETVDGILESLYMASMAIGANHPFYRNLETIFQKVPAELKDRMNRRQSSEDSSAIVPSEKSLIRLHKQTIKALQTLQRTETQWGILVEEIFHLEDIAKNQMNIERKFNSSFPVNRSLFMRFVYNPTIEWYWNCLIKNYMQKIAAIITACLSVAVVWSEVTFFNKSPVLSLFALFLNLAKISYDYFTIEILSTMTIAYLCYCAYSTILKIRFLNLYYLAPHHQTNEYSLIFSGMMLCRLTPPMCLNFLGLIHMDSHIIKTHILETHYTQVMGHMDVISIISDGFNVYFPMAILAFCLATYFSLGSRLLSILGFQQFLDDDQVTTDHVDDGKELIQREKRRRLRIEESKIRRQQFQGRINNQSSVISRNRNSVQRQNTDIDYSMGTTFNTSTNFHDLGTTYRHSGYQADNLNDSLSTESNYSALPRRIFDDV
ncbi:LMBR1 domain-containing protein 2 homolog isoform X2 [Chelonus insularis]|uniref:LMBR1 domain-containing protein 2 homolog isoform X2 n=1 Tax=Chelonus insularis TaxID=460826 RepID=UPI00158F15C2|nr:LMBR1 domain-containing protein 2 homolog isoform X2 [Chelonus insularis]